MRAKLIRPNADGVRELSGILTGREGSTVTLESENGPVTFEVNAPPACSCATTRICSTEKNRL